jgi:acyl-CoA thioester hydrolase
MADRFSVRVTVRSYELDANGHVNGAVYLQYAEHARWELMATAGVDQLRLRELGFGPVNLETVIRYHSELYYADTVDVSCEIQWGPGKTFRVPQELRRVDGTLVAEVNNVGGLLDLGTRRLVAAPGEQFRKVTTTPELLGL